jgi:hypothetical protein
MKGMESKNQKRERLAMLISPSFATTAKTLAAKSD